MPHTICIFHLHLYQVKLTNTYNDQETYLNIRGNSGMQHVNCMSDINNLWWDYKDIVIYKSSALPLIIDHTDTVDDTVIFQSLKTLQYTFFNKQREEKIGGIS